MMTPRAESEVEMLRRMRVIYRRTLSLWASDYLYCRSLWYGPVGAAPPPWSVEPLIERARRDAA